MHKLSNIPVDLTGLSYRLIHSNTRYNHLETVTDEAHIHDHYEIYLNISGDVNFLVNGSVYPITPGDIVITRPNELHYCLYKKSCIHEHFCLWLSQTEGSSLLDFIDTSSLNLLSFDKDTKDKLSSLFYKMNESLSNPLYSTSYLLDIMRMLSHTPAEAPSTYTEVLPVSMQDILKYINLNYPNITNVNDICNIFHISPSTLNRWFKKYTHLPPKAYLESIKLSNARQMLNSGASVTDACYGCGYTDCSHFIKVFKNNIGQTPLQYKNNE